MTGHRPTDEMLADFAFGAALPGTALLVAAHLTHSPESRARVAALEGIGGAFLEDEAPADMAPGALDAVLAKIDMPAEIAPTEPVDQGPLPLPVIDALGMGFTDIPWKFRLPGGAEYELDGYGDQKVSLLRARAGAKVPQHTHEGLEMTLILQGALQDGGTVYRKGDVSINDEDDDHRPQAVGDETCYCLIVQQGGLKFTGTFSRILNYLGE